MQNRLSVLLTRGDPTVRADDPEPSLRELLDDPLLMLVLRSDRLRRADLLAVIELAQRRLGRGLASRAAHGRTVCAECPA